MARIIPNKTIARLSMIMLISGTIAGCAEKDLYDSDWNKKNLPSEESYFGYEMRGSMELSINYNAPGFQTIIEIYDQNPVSDGVKKEGLKPIYSAYINNGQLKSKMYVPTSIKEAYLYTDNWSLPQCIKMELSKDGVVYDATKASASTRGVSTRAFFGETAPYKIADDGGYRYDFLYSLSKWNNNGRPDDVDYISATNEVKGELISSISARTLKAFDDKEVTDKSTFLRPPGVTNINIKEDNTTLDVVLLAERGEYQNTFGYYYYKTGKELGEDELTKDVQKFIVFPDASIDNRVLSCGATAQLLFFGDNGEEAATVNFPKDYTIGWFFISDGYNENGTIEDGPFDVFRFYSNSEENNRRFVSMNDKQTGIVILGFEDAKKFEDADDYSDVLFFVKSNKTIIEDGRPEIPPGEPELKPGTFTLEGTLAFEDIWPTGGDYDMNDVVVEYKRTVSFDADNKTTKITEKFKPVHDGAGVDFNNVFAYQVKSPTTITPQEGVVYEADTKSIIINSSIKEIQNKEYTIERTFDSADKDDVLKDFNPFIIVKNYEAGKRDRKEVHLPKHLPTEYADKSLSYTADDAYYIKRDGRYPFAMDIPMLEFKIVTEGERIDAAGEYPKFGTWAESGGTKETEWYKEKRQ